MINRRNFLSKCSLKQGVAYLTKSTGLMDNVRYLSNS